MNGDLDAAVKALNGVIGELIDRQAPLRKFVARKPHVLGVTSEVGELMARRDRVWRKARRSGSMEAMQEFRKIRVQVKKLMRANAARVVLGKFEVAENARALWMELDRLGLTKRSGNWSRFAVPLDVSADSLNDYFVVMARTLGDVMTASRDIDVPNESELPVLDRPGFEFRAVTEGDVRVAFRAIASQAIGQDQMSIRHYQAFGDALYPVFVRAFNKSLEDAIFPAEWKRSLVLPLCKVRGSHLIQDFRPICVLPVLSKVFERIVHKQLLSYVLRWDILGSRQCGFRPNYGTQTAVLTLHEDVRRAADRKMQKRRK